MIPRSHEAVMVSKSGDKKRAQKNLAPRATTADKDCISRIGQRQCQPLYSVTFDCPAALAGRHAYLAVHAAHLQGFSIGGQGRSVRRSGGDCGGFG